ncbi:MAG: hypothetical protein ACFFD9_11205 [Candidatus Thorarchaeota archaeon]
MTELETLRKGLVSILDGLWWGLRDNVGPLSMYEGYIGGFRLMGSEFAETAGEKGPKGAASMAAKLFSAIGLEVELEGDSVRVISCPIWNRILERGLEYAFHVEEICWRPMLEGIGEKAGAEPIVESSLRLAHLERAKLNHKRSKAKLALEEGAITEEEYQNQSSALEDGLKKIPNEGLYRFE